MKRPIWSRLDLPASIPSLVTVRPGRMVEELRRRQAVVVTPAQAGVQSSSVLSLRASRSEEKQSSYGRRSSRRGRLDCRAALRLAMTWCGLAVAGTIYCGRNSSAFSLSASSAAATAGRARARAVTSAQRG